MLSGGVCSCWCEHVQEKNVCMLVMLVERRGVRWLVLGVHIPFYPEFCFLHTDMDLMGITIRSAK